MYLNKRKPFLGSVPVPLPVHFYKRGSNVPIFRLGVPMSRGSNVPREVKPCCVDSKWGCRHNDDTAYHGIPRRDNTAIPVNEAQYQEITKMRTTAGKRERKDWLQDCKRSAPSKLIVGLEDKLECARTPPGTNYLMSAQLGLCAEVLPHNPQKREESPIFPAP